MLPDSGSPKYRSQSVLFLAQLPPPYHGQSAVAATIYDILSHAPGVEVRHLWRGGAQSNQDVGRRTLAKYAGFARLVLELIGLWISGRRFDFAYLGLAPWAHTVSRDAVLAWLAKRVSSRVLLHVHGEGISAVVGEGTHADLYRRGFGGCELLAITAKTAGEAEASGIFSNVIELPNAAEDPGQRTIGSAGPLTVCCLGNLDARKGVFDFVDVIGELKRRGVPVRATIMGRSTANLTAETLKERVSNLGLSDAITVTGAVDEAEKAATLSRQDVFLYLSRHDLAPLAVIEALAHANAPIVIDIGGLREMVGPKLSGNVLGSAWPREDAIEHAADLIAAYAADRSVLARDQAYARARYIENYRPDVFRARVLGILTGDVPQPGNSPAGPNVLLEAAR